MTDQENPNVGTEEENELEATSNENESNESEEEGSEEHSEREYENFDAPEVSTKKWEELNLSADTIKVVTDKGFANPTEVQAEAIPAILKNKDTILYSFSGSGKKASYVLPIVDRFAGKTGTHALVLAPNFETASQIEGVFKMFGDPRMVSSLLLNATADFEQEKEALKGQTVIISTLERIQQHLDAGTLTAENFETVVLDEADVMIKNGAAETVKTLCDRLTARKQTVFIAPLPIATTVALADQVLKSPEIIKVGVACVDLSKAKQHLVFMQVSAKVRELKKLFEAERGQTVIFVRSKDGASRLAQKLTAENITDMVAVHHELDRPAREQIVAEFLDGKHRVLITSENVSKKMNLSKVALLINYDLPLHADDYVLRMGRVSANDGAILNATSFVTPYDERALTAIEGLLGEKLTEEFTEGAFIPDNYVPRHRHRGRRGGRHHRGGGGGGGGRSGGGRGGRSGGGGRGRR